MNRLEEVGGRYGATMGRSNNIIDNTFPVVFEIERLQWVSGDYDQGGAYWGSGNGRGHIYRAEGESTNDIEKMFVRAETFEDAKTQILANYPNASFGPSHDLNMFLAGYIEAALFSSHNDKYEADRENEAEMLDDAGYSLSEETETHFRAECERFLEENTARLSEIVSTDYPLEQAGNDFWMTRNRHGLGFQDRTELGAEVYMLVKAAHGFGEDNLYVGGDNLVHSFNEEGKPAALRI